MAIDWTVVPGTGATEFIDLTTADVFLEEVWSQQLVHERQKKLVFAANVDRRQEQYLKKGQVLRIGQISNLAARAKSANSAISYETITETEATVTINNYYYAAFAMEDVITPMVSVNLVGQYMPKIGYALALQEDSDIAALIDDGDITQTVGTLATNLTHDNLIRADQYLNDAEAPEDERCIIISHAEKAGFLKMDQFVHKDYSDLRQGLLGGWLGQYPIYVTGNTNGDNTNGHDCVMIHKSAIVHIQQIKPVIKTFWDIDYFAAKVAALETYGHTVVRPLQAVWLKAA